MPWITSRMAELMFRLEHRHSDGSWGSLEPRPAHHDAAEHDPEAGGRDGHDATPATTCDEQVRVRIPDGGAGRPGARR